MLYNIIFKDIFNVLYLRQEISWKTCVKSSSSLYLRDYAKQLPISTSALLRMESRLFDNGQTEERSRFPCVEDSNCAHSKHLHFKGLLLACIMFDTGARSSQSQLVETSISTTRAYSLHARILLQHTHSTR